MFWNVVKCPEIIYYLTGGQVVGGSNPLVPTNLYFD